MATDTSFQEWLRTAMRERGLGNNQLAQRAGVAQSAVSEYLSGKQLPQLKSIRKLAAFFKIDAGELEEIVEESRRQMAPTPIDSEATDIVSRMPLTPEGRAVALQMARVLAEMDKQGAFKRRVGNGDDDGSA